MPKLAGKITAVTSPKHREVTLISIRGIISTPTIQKYRRFMAKPVKGGRDIVIDLGGVSYINSSGLGELVRVHDYLEQSNLYLMVINVDKEVNQLLVMLGLGNLLHIFPTLKSALESLDDGMKVPEVVISTVPEQRGKGFVPVVSAPPPRLPEARILIYVNGDGYFAKFLARCLSGKGGNGIVVSSRKEAQEAAREGRVDLAILDGSLADAGGICSDLKLARGNGILSVIMIHLGERQGIGVDTCRISEDEYVSEPFEVRELVSLAECEFQRCRGESILFVQEANLEIATSDAGVEKSFGIIENMIQSAGLSSESRDGFFYAVREAIDNARRHGNRSDSEKIIELLYVLDKEKITVTVGDEGAGFDFASVLKVARESTPIEQARTQHSKGGYGGLGIGLMLRCCDKVDYISPGNVVKLTKYV